MGERKMHRGKQQILFNYLPGKTFDYEGGAIARVSEIRGQQRTDVDSRALLLKVREEAQAWPSEFRPVLRDEVLNDQTRFVLIEPHLVESEFFPKVFWCQNKRCNRVFDYTESDALPGGVCESCGTGRLVQLRFVRVHRCGALMPLVPPRCEKCRNTDEMALDTAGSEKMANFSWLCRRCQTRFGLLPTPFHRLCSSCRWPDAQMRSVNIEVHRARRTFYAHSTVLINPPGQQLNPLFAVDEWPMLVGAKVIGLPEVADISLRDLATARTSTAEDTGLSDKDLENLLDKQALGEISAEEIVEQIRQLRDRRQLDRSPYPGTLQIASQLVEQTGLNRSVWENAGQELLETGAIEDAGGLQSIFPAESQLEAADKKDAAGACGLSNISLIPDFPLLNATYGYTRVEFAPRRSSQDSGCLCRLNAFPAKREYGGRIPIFIDEVRADAIIVTLDSDRVYAWLEANELRAEVPNGTNAELSRRAHFVELFNGLALWQTVRSKEARLVFGLIHTMSHLCVRKAALLCGLDRTSLSEYLLPRSLTFVIYCNHRFGATIGSLTALFEQSLIEWLRSIDDARRCVYDPVCGEREGSCHACTHLAETSCRFFNLNLSRALLFGGNDPVVGTIQVGYLDPILRRQ